MQKSALILLVLSALLVLGTEAQNTINNFLATRLLFDLDLDCPVSRLRRGGTVSRAEINQAFTVADINRDNGLNEKELDLFEEIIDAFEDCIEMD